MKTCRLCAPRWRQDVSLVFRTTGSASAVRQFLEGKDCRVSAAALRRHLRDHISGAADLHGIPRLGRRTAVEHELADLIATLQGAINLLAREAHVSTEPTHQMAVLCQGASVLARVLALKARLHGYFDVMPKTMLVDARVFADTLQTVLARFPDAHDAILRELRRHHPRDGSTPSLLQRLVPPARPGGA